MADRTITASPDEDVPEERVISYSPEPEEEEVPTICIKVENSGFVRQLVLEQVEARTVSWALFQEKVKELFRFPTDATIAASYRDADGDNIRIDSDIDLKYLLKLKAIPKLQIAVEHVSSAKPQNSTTSSLPGYDDQAAAAAAALAERVATVAVAEKDTNHLEFHPESVLVIDMVVDLVFSDPHAMREAIGTLHELSESTKIPLSEIFESFNDKLKNHVPKETHFSANHVDTCAGITDACRHLHYDLPPAYTDDALLQSDPATVAASETAGKKTPIPEEEDKDEYYDATGPELVMIPAASSSTPAPSPAAATGPLTTAQLQQQYKSQRKQAQRAGSINEYLATSFARQKTQYATPPKKQQETPPNSEWATPASSPARTETANNSAKANFSFSLRHALNSAAASHAQMHAAVLHQNPWISSAFQQAQALKDATCATIDSTVPGAKALKQEAREAYRFVSQATGAALTMATESPEEEVRIHKEKEHKEAVERILKMEVASGATRERVVELVREHDADIQRVVNELINDRL
ncbi:hypothetical protein BDR26DRAFT_862621, partial [Obelidium mucronatum]